MGIFANHSHLLPFEGKNREGLKKFMEECGIDQSVCFAPFELPDGVKDQFPTANHWLNNEIKADPDLFGFGTIDFSKSNICEQVNEIADFGFKGIKIHGPQQMIPLTGEKAFEVYRHAEEIGLFISFHTGVHFDRIKPTHTLLYDEIAYNFKNLKFSMEHVGGYSGFYDAMSVLINNRPWPDVHLYAGLTSILSERTKEWYLGIDRIRDIYWQLGEDREIFGTDFPWQDVETTQFAISTLENNLDLSAEAKEKLFGGNLRTALGLM
jgi:predicted TIM-barrel fold metal-dependent hydrolase